MHDIYSKWARKFKFSQPSLMVVWIRSETLLLRTDDHRNNHRIKRIRSETDFRFKSYQEECSSRVVEFWMFRLLRLKAQVHVYCKINIWIPTASFADPYWKIYWIFRLNSQKKLTFNNEYDNGKTLMGHVIKVVICNIVYPESLHEIE